MAWYDAYIVTIPGVQGGSPVVRGSRTPVRTVATFYHVTYDRDLDEVRTALPHLTSEQIQAALAYYEDHRAEVDADIARHRQARERGLRAS